MSTPKPSKGDVGIWVGATLVAAVLCAGLMWTWTEHPELLKHVHLKRL